MHFGTTESSLTEAIHDL